VIRGAAASTPDHKEMRSPRPLEMKTAILDWTYGRRDRRRRCRFVRDGVSKGIGPANRRLGERQATALTAGVSRRLRGETDSRNEACHVGPEYDLVPEERCEFKVAMGRPGWKQVKDVAKVGLQLDAKEAATCQ
jgi:hypothetical protein